MGCVGALAGALCSGGLLLVVLPCQILMGFLLSGDNVGNLWRVGLGVCCLASLAAHAGAIGLMVSRRPLLQGISAAVVLVASPGALLPVGGVAVVVLLLLAWVA